MMKRALLSNLTGRWGGWSAVFALGLCLAASAPALADEADDMQATIERERRGAADLKRLDETKAAAEDIALIDVWLNLAWSLRGEQNFDRAREVLERVDAQKDMIREKITAAHKKLEAAKAEAQLAAVRQRIKTLKQDIAAAAKKKVSLEGKAK